MLVGMCWNMPCLVWMKCASPKRMIIKSCWIVAVWRVARGEVISGAVFIRTYALGHLLHLWVATLDTPTPAILDNLDVYRRFERAFPALGEHINAALNTSPLAAAQGLLAIYQATYHHLPTYPNAAVETVQQFLATIP